MELVKPHFLHQRVFLPILNNRCLYKRRQCPSGPVNRVGRLMKGEPPGGPLFWLLLHKLTTRGANIDNNIINSRGNVTQVKTFYLEYLCWSRIVGGSSVVAVTCSVLEDVPRSSHYRSQLFSPARHDGGICSR